jgi:hypothetical protein
MRSRLALLWLGLLLAGCQTAPRRAAPPELIGTATPPGFPPSVRLLTTDQRTFSALAPDFFSGIRNAAIDGTVDILALSGGGSGGAYGAGALTGLSRAHARPQFEMVTGVSAGALLAPFAFLGSAWDTRMQEAFTGERSARLLRGAHLYMIVNGQLARTPQTTRYNTIDILSNAFDAELTYKTREAIVDNIAAAKRLGMQFRLTEIPVDYPQTSFIDFDQTHMQALFDYAADCAARGLLWLTPAQSVRRNMGLPHAATSNHPACPVPATSGTASQ